MKKKVLAIITTNVDIADFKNELINDVQLHYGNSEDMYSCDDVSFSFDVLDDNSILNTLKELRSDLFYQIESVQGSKVANQYPSIVKVDKLINSL